MSHVEAGALLALSITLALLIVLAAKKTKWRPLHGLIRHDKGGGISIVVRKPPKKSTKKRTRKR